MKDRVLLNDRFKVAFQQLVEDGRIVSHSRDESKSISGFARKLGTEPHIVKLWLKDVRLITYEQAKRLCREYGVSEEFMFQDITNPKYYIPSSVGNIIHVSLPTFGGEGSQVMYDEMERYRLPGLEGEWYSFPVVGNSMAPGIDDGDTVLCKKVELTQVKNLRVYVIILEDGESKVKRVERFYDTKSERCTHFLLKSDNTVDYPNPGLLEILKISAIFEVHKKIASVT